MKTVRIFIIFTSLQFLIVISGFGQYNNSPFIKGLNTDSSRTNSLYFSLESLSFLKNNEYRSYIADGYTLFGFQFLPYFSYYASKNIRINAGVYLQKDFGNRVFSRIEPFFSVKVTRKNFNIIFGNLEGALNHKLIEPLYDFERVLNDRQEFGLQFLLKRETLFADLWVDWEKMIYKGDPNQEEITGGFNIRKTFHLSSLEIGIPLQLFVYHRGGQIDSSPGYLLTRLNAAAGLDLKLPLGDLVQSINGSAYYVHSVNGDRKEEKSLIVDSPPVPFPSIPQYPEFSKGDTLVYGNGKGFYSNLGVDLKHNIRLMASFWFAENFSSQRGGQLYPSESSSFKKAGLIVNRRTLLIGRIFHDWKISDLATFSTRVEPYWDLTTRTFEYSFGFYLNVRPEIFLWQNK